MMSGMVSAAAGALRIVPSCTWSSPRARVCNTEMHLSCVADLLHCLGVWHGSEDPPYLFFFHVVTTLSLSDC